MDQLTIVTVSARPNNIKTILNNIIEQKKYWDGELKWSIIFDFDKESNRLTPEIENLLNQNSGWTTFRFLPNQHNKSSGGNHGKNTLIKEIQDGWIYQLDDDNLLYPNFLQKISELIKKNIHTNLFVFWQSNRYSPKKVEDLSPGYTDTAMYFFHKKIAKSFEYPLNYGGDGQFLQLLLNNPQTEFFIEQSVLCWYNQLSAINTPMKDLSKLAVKYGSDKYSRHKYTEIYQDLFLHLKDQSIKFLELGVLNGASLHMWTEWFSQAFITGVDIDLNQVTTVFPNSVRLVQADSQNIDICEKLGREQFDIILDDADHHPYSQLKTLWNTWPLLKKGGLYIIEDIQNFHLWSEHWSFFNYKLYDQRNNGGTYDSVLLVIQK